MTVPAAAQTPFRRSAARTLLALALTAVLALPLSGISAVAPAAAAPTAPAVTLSGLQVEKKTTPIGIDVEKPRFSWIIESTARGVMQQSYRLRLATTPERLAAGTVAWDSGVVESIESSNVEYTGPQLDSATRYYWSVDVVTGAGAASATSEFRTGLYDADTDWADSEWIGNDRVQDTGAIEMNLTGASWIHPPYGGGNTPPGYFRKLFTVTPGKTIESAEFVGTGDRSFSAFLNGTQIASIASVDDEWKKAARVKAFPSDGENVLAIRLNNTAKAYGAAIGKLTILFTDGTTQDIVTDASWLSTQSATTGWETAGYSTASGWVAATARAVYGGAPWGEQVVVPKTATADARLNFDTASWITPQIGATSPGNPVPSSLFRRTLTVPADKTVAFAQLAVTGDQVFQAYWNGTKVASNIAANDEWQKARTVNLTTVPGDNVIAFSLATNNTQYGGVLARVRIGYTDGTSTDYVTNGSTKTLIATEATAPAGWNTVGFDDSAWTAAQSQALYRGWVYGDRVAIPDLATGTDTLTLAGAPWIWTPEASTGTAPGEPRAFRTVRTSPAGKQAQRAEILITADDSFALSVNGDLIGATEGAVNEWQQSHLYTVDLEADSNLFAVKTTNGAGSAAGLIAKVRVRYTDGTSDTFTTGTDWKSSKTIDAGFEQPGFDDSAWIPAVQQAVYGSGPWGSGVRAPVPTPNAAPLLRKEFAVDGDVRTATLFLAAGGYADITLNGTRISRDMLSPGFTDYDDTVQYVATDLTDQVKAGDNAIGMELGRGFYGMTGSNVWNWQAPPWHDEPVVRAVLHLEYADGTTDDVVTDDSWTIHDGPTVFDDLYGGEKYDLNRVQTGFDTVGFDAANWAPASEVRGPKGVLVNQRQQPIRVTEELPATTITEPVDGTYVVKFPRVLAGNVKLTARGATGDTIRFQYGEKLRTDGTVNFDNNGGFGSGFQTDRLVLAGTGSDESWAARFSYKGFQYIQVTGWPAGSEPTLANFTAQAVHTDAAETGTFESANDIMNRTHSAVVDTLENNIHGIPTDTPMFEKNGWTGDAAVGAEMFMMNLDTHELFAKWMRDVNETRDAEGAPMVIAPSSGSWGEWGVAPPWHSAYILIPRWLYQYGNDSRVMDEYYDGMKGYIDLEFNRSDDGIVSSPRLGDWVSPEASPAGGNAPEDTRVSGTAYLYTMLTAMAKTAEFLGHDADVAEFEANAEVVKDAFNAKFLDEDKGYYVGSGDAGYRQTHNVLALAFDLTPNADVAKSTAASIVADIAAKGNHLNTGVLGTKYLLPVLTQYGYADVAYGLATQTTYPSWGYIVENGGTTMWEHWSLEARSLGHYFLGTVDDWFYHGVAGIQPSDTEGYRNITIAPAVTKQLAWAKGSTESPFGTVATDWTASAGTLALAVDIPVGSKATVRIPAANAWAVSEGGIAIDDVDGVTKVEESGTDVLVSIGSGHYEFAVDDTLGEVGEAVTLLDDADALLTELRADGELNSTQRARLSQLLGTTRATALTALDKVRAGDKVGAATAVVAAMAQLTTFDTAVKALDTSSETRSAILAASIRIRLSLEVTVSDLLSVTATATLNQAAYKPGEKAVATVRLVNGGKGVLGTSTARITGLTWAIAPASQVLATSLAAGKTAQKAFTLTVPLSSDPGSNQATAAVAYAFSGRSIRLTVPVTVKVDSAIVVKNVTAAPATVAPGETTTVTTVVQNTGKQATAGRVEIAVPEGWATPLPTDAVVVGAGKSVSTTVQVTVPSGADTATVTEQLKARFVRNGATLASGNADLTVELAELVEVDGYDHIDLGDQASEEAHDLEASASSGTNSEAGLTRRYAGHLTPFSYFEFDLAVKQGEPFVVRSIETYDKSQTKRYKVYVDGQEVTLRQFPHTTGAGTETWEFAVPAELATSDSVRVKFETQDDAAFYDPSIADVWTQPLPADTVAPALGVTLDPATPNLATGWYQQTAVGVSLVGLDAIEGDVDVRYGVDGTPFSDYTEPFTVKGQGTHVLRYQATDAAGNVGTKSTTIKIDTVKPTAAAKLSSAFTNNVAKKSGKITFAGKDATSGISSVRVRINGGAWVVRTSLTVTRKGKNVVQYSATDKAGNVSATGTVRVTIK